MLTQAAMEDLTELCNQYENLVKAGLSGVIPEDSGATRLIPYVLGSLLELTRQLVYHVKQLQLEVVSLGQQLHNRDVG